jgi:hypothetical protein
MSDLVERLRGIYRTPITDGLGPVGSGDEPDNPDEFVRTFPVPPIHRKAADEIERLTAERDAARADRDSHQREAIRAMEERASALAKVAKYEQAPVVGWGVLIGSWVEFATSRRAADEIAEPYDNVTVVALTARPEASK